MSVVSAKMEARSVASVHFRHINMSVLCKDIAQKHHEPTDVDSKIDCMFCICRKESATKSHLSC